MARRNIIIVDDILEWGVQVQTTINKYYHSKEIFDIKITPFITEHHFEDAKLYIEKYYEEIDIIFSDQKLTGGLGTDLFKSLDKKVKINRQFNSIQNQLHVFKVMHSNLYESLNENQKEYSRTYNYFVNSVKEEDIFNFLDYYEKDILFEKENGNKSYIEYLSINPKLIKLFEIRDGLTIDKHSLRLRDIVFIVMDKEKNNSDYYYFFYFKNGEIIQSSHSIKPTFAFNHTGESFNSIIDSLSFIGGILAEDKKEKFKVNPLWVSSIDIAKSKIIFFSPTSFRYEIKFGKFDNNSNNLIDENNIDEFFL